MNFTLFYVTLGIFTLLLWIITLTGNIILLVFTMQRKRVRYMVGNRILSNIAACHIIVSFIAYPFHAILLINSSQPDSILCGSACIGRYYVTFTLSSVSLLALTLLCWYRKDYITKSNTVPISITNSRVTLRLIIIWLSTVGINFIALVAYAVIYEEDRITACRPSIGKNIESYYYVGLAESVKIGCIGVICAIAMVSCMRSVKKHIVNSRGWSRTSTMHITSKKRLKASFAYAAAFLAPWIPIGGVTFVAKFIPENSIYHVYNVVYTIGYCSFAVIPIVYAMSDRNFHRFLRPTSNAVIPKSDNHHQQILQEMTHSQS